MLCVQPTLYQSWCKRVLPLQCRVSLRNVVYSVLNAFTVSPCCGSADAGAASVFHVTGEVFHRRYIVMKVAPWKHLPRRVELAKVNTDWVRRRS